jgi:23S rRNA (adenine1618-N6)-methyltransferase
LDALATEPKIDFVMCNPPFFTSEDDMMATWTNKSNPPSAVCTGAPVEMITSGGDFGFALRIVEESREHQKRVQWYTCMLGKLQSAIDLVSHLKEIDCGNWAVGTLIAGSKTRRWVVGWSWDGLRPSNVSLSFLFLQRVPDCDARSEAL